MKISKYIDKLFKKNFLKRLFPSKELREYRKMHRKHRKELIKLAKETREWDFCYLHQMVIMQIKHMYEYYSAGNDVWQSDETLNMVLKSLNHILDLQEELDTLYDVYNLDTEYLKTLDTRETELYEEIYTNIGQNIQWWWD